MDNQANSIRDRDAQVTDLKDKLANVENEKEDHKLTINNLKKQYDEVERRLGGANNSLLGL
jgi:predicted  nucleic acid-binding Zn-ribbon protein